MFEKNMKMAFLLDFYGEVLEEHTRTLMEAYYDEDLSLAEIADGEGISRQGVRHVIKKGEEQLLFLEERLHLAAHYEDLQKAAEILTSLSHKMQGSDRQTIMTAVKTILNKG